jgi:formylglycine-generating enzyme
MRTHAIANDSILARGSARELVPGWELRLFGVRVKWRLVKGVHLLGVRIQRSVFAALLSLTLGACGGDSAPVAVEPEISLSVAKPSGSTIDSAEVIVSGPSISERHYPLLVGTSTLEGAIPAVPAGQSLTFTINAFDVDGTLIYTGSTTVDVAGPNTSTVEIFLAPVQVITIVETEHPVPDGSVVPMVLIPAGDFAMGTNFGEVTEGPVHDVYLDAYNIGKFEVTSAQYQAFLDANPQDVETLHVYTNPREIEQIWVVSWPARADLPVPTSRIGAAVYCEWIGARLPTEAEWEKAARGTDERIFPWGEGINPSLAKYFDFISETGLVPVGSFPDGVSPYGAHDMAGNASEWVSDTYDGAYYYYSPRNNPLGASSEFPSGVVRGGSERTEALRLKTTSRQSSGLTNKDNGFRCAMDAD